MKTKATLLTIVLVTIFSFGCGVIEFGSNTETITPSGIIITEDRTVSGFSGIDFSTIGSVTITQGDSESLVVKGSDNLVPLVRTSVKNGVLEISMEENINIQSMNRDDILTFEIRVKDLDRLTVSGLGTVDMDALDTPSLQMTLSGAGGVRIKSLTTQQLDVTISGLGGATLAGAATDMNVEISGAGELMAGDLECRTAEVNIPGLGTATVWVTDTLTGEISGGGSVRYYGGPKTNTKSTGLGTFEALGNK